MQITITKGIGEGVTTLAAFDNALINSGVANYNLILLSSVIPENSVIRREMYITPLNEHGHRLYVVMARQDENRSGTIACAGLGWVQDKKSKRGLFVEQQGNRKNIVKKAIYDTLESMISTRPYNFGTIHSEIISAECRDKPICAVVIAVYKSQNWDN